MKKALALLIVLMLVFSALSAAVFAEDAEQMVPVVVSVPEGWEAPHIWAWADDGTNAFASWPGEEMDSLTEGWYYTYVPAFVQNVIINANQNTDAGVQTDAVIVEAGKEVWLTVKEDASAEVSYESLLRIDIPEYVEKFLVHAYVPLSWKTVNMWAWSAPDGTNAFESWPGAAMVEGENGWFTGKAPVWINSLIINGNDGTVQTEDVSIEAKELWITVYEDLSYELAYEDPDKAVPDVTVHAQVPEDWAAPCCWAWSAPDGTNAFSAWPGEPLTEDGNWYTVSVPGWINSVIINGNEGTVQTTDLSVESGRDIWVVVSDAENAAFFYEEPEAAAVDTEQAPEEEPAEEPEVTEAPVTEPEQAEGPAGKGLGTGGIIGICAAVVAAAGGTAVAVQKKKKK